jgi:hypothetical protein
MAVGLFVIGYIAWNATARRAEPTPAPPPISMSPPPGAPKRPTPDLRFPVGAETNLNGCENRTGDLVVPTVSLWAEPGDFAEPGQRVVAKRAGTSKAARCRGARVQILGTKMGSVGVLFVNVSSDGASGWVTERLVHPAK